MDNEKEGKKLSAKKSKTHASPLPTTMRFPSAEEIAAFHSFVKALPGGEKLLTDFTKQYEKCKKDSETKSPGRPDSNAFAGIDSKGNSLAFMVFWCRNLGEDEIANIYKCKLKIDNRLLDSVEFLVDLFVDFCLDQKFRDFGPGFAVNEVLKETYQQRTFKVNSKFLDQFLMVIMQGPMALAHFLGKTHYIGSEGNNKLKSATTYLLSVLLRDTGAEIINPRISDKIKRVLGCDGEVELGNEAVMTLVAGLFGKQGIEAFINDDVSSSFGYIGKKSLPFIVNRDQEAMPCSCSPSIRIGSWNLNMISVKKSSPLGGQMPTYLLNCLIERIADLFEFYNLQIICLQEVSLSLGKLLCTSDLLKKKGISAMPWSPGDGKTSGVGVSFGGVETHVLLYRELVVRSVASLETSGLDPKESTDKIRKSQKCRISAWTIELVGAIDLVVIGVHLAADQAKAETQLSGILEKLPEFVSAKAPGTKSCLIVGDFNLDVSLYHEKFKVLEEESIADQQAAARSSKRKEKLEILLQNSYPLVPALTPTSTGMNSFDNLILVQLQNENNETTDGSPLHQWTKTADGKVCKFVSMRSEEWWSHNGNFFSDHFMVYAEIQGSWPVIFSEHGHLEQAENQSNSLPPPSVNPVQNLNDSFALNQ